MSNSPCTDRSCKRFKKLVEGGIDMLFKPRYPDTTKEHFYCINCTRYVETEGDCREWMGCCRSVDYERCAVTGAKIYEYERCTKVREGGGRWACNYDPKLYKKVTVD